jgi:hypothetical protein
LKNQPLQFFERKLAEWKTTKRKLLRFTKINEKAMHTSYLINLGIAKAGKQHTIGECLVLPAIKDAVGVMFDNKSSKEVETIQLSNNTVARRIDEMSQWTEDQLIQRVGESKFFSLQLDGSTDVQVCTSCLLSYVTYGTTNRLKISCAANQLFEVIARKYSRPSILM